MKNARSVKMQEPVICPTWQRKLTEAVAPVMLASLRLVPWYALTAWIPVGAETIVH